MIRAFFFAIPMIAACLLSSASQAAHAEPAEDAVPRDPAWESSTGLLGDTPLPARARHFETKGRLAKAARLYRRMGDKATHAKSRTYALTKAGDCFFDAGKYSAARDTYEKALDEAAGRIRYGHILQRLRKLVGEFEEGAGRWFGSNLSSAIGTLELILETAPLNSHAASDRLRLGNLYRQNSQYEQATATFRSLIHQYPRKPEAQKARFRLASMLLKRGSGGDQDGTLHGEAKSLLKHYLSQAEPTDAKRAEAREMLDRIHAFHAAQILNKARFYSWDSHRRPKTARRYLNMLEQPPYEDTPAAAQAEELARQMAAKPEKEAVPDASESPVKKRKGEGAGAPLKKWLLPVVPINEN